jgi:tetratricopeptide (TPR) repeat protein
MRVEQRNNRGKNYQVRAKHIEHVGDIYQGSSINAEELLNQGIHLLKHGAFQQAINVLNDAVKANPSLSDAYYHLALASMKGNRPKVLQRSEVEAIDQLLSIAISLDQANGVFHLFRALVRHDYYEINRLRYPPPSVEQILGEVKNELVDSSALLALLNQIPMRNNPLYSALKSKLVQEI